MKRSSVVLFGLGLFILGSGCTRPVNDGSVTALNLKTGETRTFASEGEVPGGWAPCGDADCSETPPGVPCQNLGAAVCTMFSECRLKEVSCMASGCTGPASSGGGSAGSEPGAAGGSDGSEPTDPASPAAPEAPVPMPPDPGCEPSEPVCEYTCIPKYPLLCDELTSEQECSARGDCEWGEQMCAMMPCDSINGCPPCPKSCGPKRPPTCDQLDEPTCGKRDDCEWMPGVCPACYSETDFAPCECKSFCQPKGPTGCPEIWFEPPADCPNPVPQYDQNGCLSGYSCETDVCPPIATMAPACEEGEKIVEVYDAKGCVVGYECAPAGDCGALSKAYAQALQAAKACSPYTASAYAQCTIEVVDALACGCTTFVNGANQAAVQKLKDLQGKWSMQGCDEELMCPTIACVAPGGATCEPQAGGGGACQDLTDSTAPASK